MTAEEARLREMRQTIADNDRLIVKLIGIRVETVRRLWSLKSEMGLELTDPSREEWLRSYLIRCNFGRLPDQAVEQIADFLLDLTKDVA